MLALCNNSACFNDRHWLTYSQHQLILITLSVCSVTTQFVCVFNHCQFEGFSIFQFKKHFFKKTSEYFSVSVLGLIDFLKSLAPKNLDYNPFFPSICIKLITSAIFALMWQIIHLDCEISKYYHSPELLTMICILFWINLR